NIRDTPKEGRVRYPLFTNRPVRECVDLDVEISHGQVAALLFAAGKGGTGVTDYIGWHAHREGYDGILFLGARAIPELDRRAIENARPDERFNNDFDNVRALRRNGDYINLVIFSGARVTTATRTYQCSGLPRWFRKRAPGICQIPPDLVVKFQTVD